MDGNSACPSKIPRDGSAGGGEAAVTANAMLKDLDII